jgi:uncharacterized damage-inducible protein DinB
MEMEQLSAACKRILRQLEAVVHHIDEKDFSRPSLSLSNNTIGQHLRHTLEFFLCLEHGYAVGSVNYDKRNHDKLMESDKFIALASLRRIHDFISTLHENRTMKLQVAFESDGEDWVTIESNYRRELVYNIEHAVHHMAIMKIGIREVAPYIQLPADFGVAISTLRYKKANAAGVVSGGNE